MKSTIAIFGALGTLVVSTFGFNGVAIANEVLLNNTEQQNQQEKIVAQVGAEVGINVDPLAIANQVKEDINSANNREGFVKGVVQEAYYSAGQKANVMVFNMNQEFEENLGEAKFAKVDYDGITYGIWIFENEGEFINKGDGGYINWGFKGQFDREGEEGKHVKFHAR